jgi:hypothetical protein
MGDMLKLNVSLGLFCAFGVGVSPPCFICDICGILVLWVSGLSVR